MYKIQTFNKIAADGLQRFPAELYEVSSEHGDPDAILLRSQKLHDHQFSDNLKAIARAGAGVNNVPVSLLTERGIPVFNAPGANANAVKELVIAGMLIASRNLDAARDFVRQQTEKGAALDKAVESGKSQFLGAELPGKTLGVVGLGAIGVLVANTATALGMRVIGFDPGITVERAWQLDAQVTQASSVDELVSQSDFISLHVPLVDATKGLFDQQRFSKLKPNTVLLNFSRAGIVDHQALLAALKDNQLQAYVSDFPNDDLLQHPKVIAFPHLGASTTEAESNSAVMVVENLRDYLENGNIRHAVNFPDVRLSYSGSFRFSIINLNRPDMVAKISHQLGVAKVNIEHMINESKADLAYTLIDADACPSEELLNEILAIDGVLSARCLQPRSVS